MKDLDRIYEENFIKVYRYILSVSGDEHLAEEITQETFYRALRTTKDFRGDCSVSTWLCVIARNLLLNQAARQNRADATAEEMKRQDKGNESAEEICVRRETADRIRQVIARMDDPYGEVLALRLYSELSFAEIGKMFGKSNSWARVVYHRARMRAKEELENENQM